MNKNQEHLNQQSKYERIVDHQKKGKLTAIVWVATKKHKNTIEEHQKCKEGSALY